MSGVYYYVWTDENGVHETSSDLSSQPGSIYIDGDVFWAGFDDVEINATIDGKELTDGVAELTVPQGKFQGDVEGLVYEPYRTDLKYSTESIGAFVSSDASDEVLFSGAWYGNTWTDYE